MTSICLSVAPNLRCQVLTRLESSIVLIPPALEIIFCVSLCIIKRGADRRHLLLAGDGLMYFVLALLDTLVHTLDGFSVSLTAFKAMDITIGALSSGPLLMLTLYLVLLAAAEFLVIFPGKIQWIIKYTLFACIPLIIVLNAIGSFLNLVYRQNVLIPGGHEAPIAVKYENEGVQTFFNSLTLVIIIVFHAVVFLLCSSRLVKLIFEKRRIENARDAANEAAFLNGLGWTALGIKLVFVEAILGFVGSSFCVITIRRGLRFLSRACLIIGDVKGLDVVEDISMFTQPRHSRITTRRSRATVLSEMFTGQQKSFLRMSDVYDPESKLEAPSSAYSSESFTIQHVIEPSPLIFATSMPTPSTIATSPRRELRPMLAVDTGQKEVSMYGKQVVVHYRHGRAPTLDLRRFSQLRVPLPEPEASADSTPPRPATAMVLSTKEKLPNPHSPTEPQLPRRPSRALSLPAPKNYQTAIQDLARLSVRPPGGMSSWKDSSDANRDIERTPYEMMPSATTMMSVKTSTSHTSDSLDVVRALAMQFPGVPPWKLAEMHRRMSVAITESDGADDDDAASADVSRSNSGKSTSSSRVGLVRRSSSVKRKPVPALEEVQETPEMRKEADAPVRRGRPRTFTLGEGRSARVPPMPERPVRLRPVTQVPSSVSESAPARRRSRSRSTGRSVASPRDKQMTSAIEYPGRLALIQAMTQDQAELNTAWEQLGQKKMRARAESIKSIRSVATRRTPSISTSSQRSSIVPEWHNVSEVHGVGFEIVSVHAGRREVVNSVFSDSSSMDD